MIIKFKAQLFYLKLFACAVFFTHPGTLFAAVVSEVVWVEAEPGVNSIRFARYENDKWEETYTPLYTSENALTSPALGTDAQGSKILIWTEQQKAKTILMSMTAEPTATGDLIWASAELHSKYGRENFAATIVHDNNDGAWVFWSATTETYSDIVMQRYNGNFWDLPIRVNGLNNVPDDTPKAQLTEQGIVRVEWTSFDLELGTSVFRSREFRPDSNKAEKAVGALVDNIEEKDISLPAFISPYAPTLFHFPTNRLIQSTRLNDAR